MDSSFAIPSETRAGSSSLPNAIDLSHHLNTLSRNRTANALKELYRYANVPNMVGNSPYRDSESS
jgi:aromatic amino acid aminotransferase I